MTLNILQFLILLQNGRKGQLISNTNSRKFGIKMSLLENYLSPLSANPTKWSNTFKQFFGKLPTNCLSVFDHFVKLAVKGLKLISRWDTSTDEAQKFQLLTNTIYFLNFHVSAIDEKSFLFCFALAILF